MASNNVMIVRHKLLEKLVALWKENQLVEKIDRVPLEFSPRRSQPVGRCCIHKERAVTKRLSTQQLARSHVRHASLSGKQSVVSSTAGVDVSHTGYLLYPKRLEWKSPLPTLYQKVQ